MQQSSIPPVNVVLHFGNLTDALPSDVDEAKVAAAPPGQGVAVPVVSRWGWHHRIRSLFQTFTVILNIIWVFKQMFHYWISWSFEAKLCMGNKRGNMALKTCDDKCSDLNFCRKQFHTTPPPCLWSFTATPPAHILFHWPDGFSESNKTKVYPINNPA